MTELTWLIFAIWIVFLLWGFSRSQSVVKGAGAIIGWFFSLSLVNDSLWLMFILFFFNVYVMFSAVFGEFGK